VAAIEQMKLGILDIPQIGAGASLYRKGMAGSDFFRL
jgi:hypothetical protein